ncbi:polyphosphate kinase 1 [Candidatus Pelagadaptatus aseana]|uniref:polyphosphate kinase 1 n=1 Tax=Candidatus Pelagadaptatus aseana TaxID=3120508 RepID=UPI003C6FC88B
MNSSTPTAPDTVTTTSSAPVFIPRELSWLSFNARVLQEAEDPMTPLIERMRFLGIFSSNMDEFFRVRVADVRRQMMLRNDDDPDTDNEQLLSEIQNMVNKLNKRFDRAYKKINKALAEKDIELLASHTQMTAHQREWLSQYFLEHIRPFISPIIAHDSLDLEASLSDDDFYLAVGMIRGSKTTYAVVEVPTKDTDRFILLPQEKEHHKQFLLLEDAIAFALNDIFKVAFEYDSVHAYSFKMTRDAELDLSNEIDESLLAKMSSGLKKRLSAEPVRLVYDENMPEGMVRFLKHRLHFSSYDSLIPSGAIRNFKDFIGMPNVGAASLEFKKMPAIPSAGFDRHSSAFEAIAERDILLYYPYHSFNYFTEWLRQASFDPKVTEIFINIYRVANNSKVLGALTDAARNGKKVTVVVELHARFDEQNNVKVSRELQARGIQVEFGIPSLKIHSKLCLITRKEGRNLKRYAHIGTGNFHERNARIYTDYSLFTAHDGITSEVAQVFQFIKYSYRHPKLQHLILSPINSRRRFNELIDNEIALARAGKPAFMKIKANNLVDRQLSEKLCEAAEAGVEIQMIIRGMVSMMPGIKGSSANIKFTSIVDRFLEHARVLVFGNGGDPKVFITSGDWMTRNIDRRVEVGTPIYDETLKQQIIDVLDIQLSDNAKARILDRNQTNQYVERHSGKKIRSQREIHNYLLEQELRAQEE